ncbi:Glutamate--cysteine ligase [Pseudidiomarina piscicola]|uniref:Glutamate--cysteine ligase n=1 Tax=Pseudidiomarina piscicola TaxID=2614830 RepID=A0A6S6WR35_9GAMM|nr:glutamate--cysteine ligase [Pseudidiomarina piscicola]CAB0150382.1 Glutamate--cysteine ligase [Pseudidiomarina piscicola]VZT39811.1 Glutamate--cysteine ligase [Pseudomonas aeruginosa]
MQTTLLDTLNHLSSLSNKAEMRRIQRGIERECLRITEDAKLASTTHPIALGKTLTHPHITTDYAEMLLEFITPVASDIQVTLAQLTDIHSYTYRYMGDELMWPLSMPCFVGKAEDIHIARYGDSHSGRMKNLYRQGLTYRYGGGMQIISGVHFNFSIPQAMWQALAEQESKRLDATYISARYFGLIRNYKRLCWVIPYLFGASPAICESFLDHTDGAMELKKLGKGTVYREYGTSLRMSDLGYTNKEQADLQITYNSLSDYVTRLRRAITTPSQKFAKIGVKETTANGEADYRQLNANILQIENEFYSPIRPKRVTEGGETPTQALERAGVEYIEVRALDVNPFSPIGITEAQIRMLDLLLLQCLLSDSPELNWDEQQVTEQNFTKVVLDGRNPRLTLNDNGYDRPISDWLEELFADLQSVAKFLDTDDDTSYQDTLAEHYQMVLNPELTLSGQMLAIMRDETIENGCLGLRLAEQYKAELTQPLSYFSEADFSDWRDASLAEQKSRETMDANTSFDEFLSDYFAKAALTAEECGQS